MTMTHAEQAEVMDEVIERISFLREQGQQEYARSENNAHANFEWVADMVSRGMTCPHCDEPINVSRDQVLMVYALKHLDGIMSYINGHESQREEVDGRIADLMVYLCLEQGMIEDDRRNDNE